MLHLAIVDKKRIEVEQAFSNDLLKVANQTWQRIINNTILNLIILYKKLIGCFDMNNEIFIRRRQKILLADGNNNDPAIERYIATLLKNLEAVGFSLSLPIINILKTYSIEQLRNFYQQIITHLKQSVGAHVQYQPMYPNFPKQVMDADSAVLYFNAIIHYLTEGKWLPSYQANNRAKLYNINLKIIELGTEQEFKTIFINLIQAKTSLSTTDKEDLNWFINSYPNAISYLPKSFPHKENMAAIIAAIIKKDCQDCYSNINHYFKTATDVLRLAVALSEGDISLATPCKFISFKRATRRLLLTLLEQCNNIEEDMLRYKKRWIRLGERLHPTEFKHFKKAAQAFYKLRNDIPIITFNSQVNASFKQQDIIKTLTLLKPRAGEFARRLDYLLRTSSEQTLIIDSFKEVTGNISTPVLLQLREHFKQRNHNPSNLRVFFPKGNIAKAFAIPNTLPSLSEQLCQHVVSICEQRLIANYEIRSPLGKVFINPQLKNYIVPFSQRSASKALKTITRGSKLAIDPDATTIRAFLWWKNGKERTDLDLSAVMLDDNWHYREHVSFTNLKLSKYKAVHSGDIVDAPNGASEFIDLDIESILHYNVRYIVLNVYSFTDQPYCDLPECFAGWMTRRSPASGEIYEPKTVTNKFDLSANSRIAIPFIIDLKERQIIWTDMSLPTNPDWYNTIEGNLRGVTLTCRAIAEMVKPNLYDLIYLNAKARGSLCNDKTEADTIFDIDSGITPLDLDIFICDFI